MNALKKNTITESLEIESERTELPPRIKKLIAAAVRVWELKRGIGATCARHRLRIRKNEHAAAGIL